MNRRASKLDDSDGDEEEEEEVASQSKSGEVDREDRVVFSEVDISSSPMPPDRPRSAMSDREWKESIERGEEGDIVEPPTERSKRILDGFRILQMNMRNADTGDIVWEVKDWGEDRYSEETDARIPKEILDMKAVTREISFTSKEEMKDFRLQQRIFLHTQCIEEWNFKFGFVIPNSTNNWQQTIHAAPKTIPAAVLSGNVTIETAFFDEDKLICKSVLRVYYV